MTNRINPLADLPAETQMQILREDLRVIRNRGPLRKMPLIRGHFETRLSDAHKSKTASAP